MRHISTLTRCITARCVVKRRSCWHLLLRLYNVSAKLIANERNQGSEIKLALAIQIVCDMKCALICPRHLQMNCLRECWDKIAWVPDLASTVFAEICTTEKQSKRVSNSLAWCVSLIRCWGSVHQKNWMPFVANNELYLIFTIEAHHVQRLFWTLSLEFQEVEKMKPGKLYPKINKNQQFEGNGPFSSRWLWYL